MYIQKIATNPSEYGASVEQQKRVAGTENTNGSGELKKQYLELAVGVKEKELERLGLGEDEDGSVIRKKDDDKDEMLNYECETCANRKYQDGSDEMVSFKSAQRVAPEAAATRVRAHEQEHVVNAYEKAEVKGGEVVRASVAIHTSVCPECGRTYVSGGTTTTTIRYNNDAYADNARKQDATVVPGANVDAVL